MGTCGASMCQSKDMLRDGSLAPTGISTNANNFLRGSATLSIIGGHLGTGVMAWYEGSCVGSSIGTGTSLTVTRTSTTMYYARATGGIGSTAADLLINTYDLGVYHSPLDSTCSSSPIIMTGGYRVGGSYIGTGVTDSLFDPSIAGVGTHHYISLMMGIIVLTLHRLILQYYKTIEIQIF